MLRVRVCAAQFYEAFACHATDPAVARTRCLAVLNGAARTPGDALALVRDVQCAPGLQWCLYAPTEPALAAAALRVYAAAVDAGSDHDIAALCDSGVSLMVSVVADLDEHNKHAARELLDALHRRLPVTFENAGRRVGLPGVQVRHIERHPLRTCLHRRVSSLLSRGRPCGCVECMRKAGVDAAVADFLARVWKLSPETSETRWLRVGDTWRWFVAAAAMRIVPAPNDRERACARH